MAMISRHLPTTFSMNQLEQFAKVCTVPGPQLWIDRRQVQLALRRSPPNETLDTNITNETGQEGVTVVAELPTTGTPTSPTMLATTSMIATTQITDGTTEGTEGTTVPRMSLPFVPSLRLGQTRKVSRWSRKWEQYFEML